MSDDFLTAESSIENNQPRELYEIVQNSVVTYRITSGVRDIAYNGFTYTAYPSARTEITINSNTNEGQLTLALPLSHPLVQRWLNQGSPPSLVKLTIYRQQPGGLVERIKSGILVSFSMEGHLGKFLVVPPLARLLTRKLPVLSADPLCGHKLFDSGCRASRTAFSIGVPGSAVPNITVAFFDGRRVQVSFMNGNPDQWSQGGQLTHVATGERMLILDQTGTMLTLQAAIPDIANGDRVIVSAGCAHDIVTCRNKFGNQVNFGGLPQLPTQNPFIPTGLGIEENDT